MSRIHPNAAKACLLLLLAGPALAQPEREQQPPLPVEEEGEEAPPDPDATPHFSETLVVTASRTEVEIINVPAPVAVVDIDAIQNQGSSHFADLVRQTPGANVIQVSNRDFNVTTRGRTGTLATSQLVLVDGRSVYQDFFGFVAWDFISTHMDDLEQVEVVRGPASAVWGANAMSGVVNLITRKPRDQQGTSLDMRYGFFDRNAPGSDLDPGSTYSMTATHAAAPTDELAWRVSLGYSHSDGFARPAGEIPNGSGISWPEYGTIRARNPKGDFRLDWDAPDGDAGLIVSGGYASNEGTLHSGVGPFHIQPGSGMGYGRVQFLRGSMEFGAFLNKTGSDFETTVSRDPAGNFVKGSLQSNTWDLSFKDERFLGNRHLVSYGGNARYITWDFTLASQNPTRNEVGLYVNDEFFINDHFRWVLGVRADRISTLEDIVLSPRTTLIFKPTPRHSIRASYNRAFRAPSLANNHLAIPLGNPAVFDLRPAFRSFFPTLDVPDEALPAPVHYTLPVQVSGNLALIQENRTAWEIGWTGALGNRLTGSAAFYINETDDNIDFTDSTFYSAENPPAGWNEAFAEVQQYVGNLAAAAPPGLLPDNVAAIGQNAAYLIPLLESLADVRLPETLTYVNREYLRDSGLELGLRAELTPEITASVNYSWQAEPAFRGFSADDIEEIPSPPTHRVNVGLNGAFGIVRAGITANYSDGAFWSDVLTSEFHGWTEPYTMVNASLSAEFQEGRLRPSIRVVNLLNQDIQQHFFGDYIKRQVTFGLRLGF